MSRNLAFSFKGAKGGVGDIGRQTKSSHVLVGSVRKAGDRVRITAQLVNASNEAQVWGERYDRDLKDIFALYGFDLNQSFASVKANLVSREGDLAKVGFSYSFLGQNLTGEAEMVEKDGRWYGKDSVEQLMKGLTEAEEEAVSEEVDSLQEESGEEAVPEEEAVD